MRPIKLDASRVSNLAKKYLDGTATEEEKRLLHEWYETVNAGDTEMVLVDAPKTTEAFGQEMLAELKEMISAEKTVLPGQAKIHPLRRWRMAAAVLVLLMMGAGIYRILKPEQKGSVKDQTSFNAKEVTAPQRSKAVITLANGKSLYLDSIPDGPMATQGKTHLVKLSDGQLAYTGAARSPEMLYNVLTVPRGSKVVSLTLTDGTKVWLNAASSLRYPVVFSDTARSVEITGEAYFEVAKDPRRKFSVKADGVTTDVLGTHFNVNTYKDEDDIKVTLLEGSIKVSATNGQRPVIIRPGQQAVVTDASSVGIRDDVDLEAVMAWKNEQFMMKGTDLHTLTRQMARWYDIEVVFEGSIPDKKFGGSVDRNVSLSTMLKALDENGIKTKLEGRTVIIL